jgi:RNA polymerase-interacting CarD/CdnL/TRCF family regulator
MAFTQSDLDAINEVIASGELTVRYADRTITYQSTEALLKARQVIIDEIAATTGTRRKRITRLYQGGSGYGR